MNNKNSTASKKAKTASQQNIMVLGKASLVTHGTQGRNHEPFRGTRVG